MAFREQRSIDTMVDGYRAFHISLHLDEDSFCSFRLTLGVRDSASDSRIVLCSN